MNSDCSTALGLKRGKVKLAAYDPIWKVFFEEEKRLLEKTFGNIIIAIEHVGSTAIPGISAKPIIDINVGVKSLSVAQNMQGKFEEIGYEYRPFIEGHTKEELRWQELFVKGSETKRTHHAHVTVFESDYWNSGLLFRDCLRKNLVLAKQYAELKERLAEKYCEDREKYTSDKDQFIKKILKSSK